MSDDGWDYWVGLWVRDILSESLAELIWWEPLPPPKRFRKVG